MTDPHAAQRAVASLHIATHERRLTTALRRTLHAYRTSTLTALRSQTAALFVLPTPATSLADELVDAAETAATTIYARILTTIAERFFPTVDLPPYDLTGRLERLAYFVAELGADTTAALDATLTAGANLGEGIPDLAGRVRDVIDTSDRRAEAISRTAVVGASNGMALDQAQEAAALVGPLTKRWLATDDERTRESHAEADGQEVPLDDLFEVGDDLLAYPGDPDGAPESTINCRCTLLFSDGSEQAAEDSG